MISIFILAEVRIYREGLVRTLGRQDGLEVLGAAADLGSALTRIRQSRPDVVLLDMLIGEGRRMIRRLKTASPELSVVALSVGDDESDIVCCAELGIAGLVDREASFDELVSTVKSAVNGELRCSPRAAAALARRIAYLSGNGGRSRANLVLTRRETQIVALIDEGCSNKDIARSLGIEVATVKNHVHNVLDKLKVRRRGEAAAHLRQLGIVPGNAVGPHQQSAEKPADR